MSGISKDAFCTCTVLVNPSRYPARANRLTRVLRKKGVKHIIESRDRRHLIHSVEDFYFRSDRYLLVWGGDGTIHDALNAAMEAARKFRSGKAMGFLRGGSGNGFQDSYEVPISLHDQLKGFAESMERRYILDVDLLKVEQGSHCRYGQLLGLGFDVSTLKKRESMKSIFSKNRKTQAGVGGYALSAILAYIGEYQSRQEKYILELSDGKHIQSTSAGEVEIPFSTIKKSAHPFLIVAGKRPYYGGRFKICPGAVPNDGAVRVYLYNFDGKLQRMSNLLSLWMGKLHRITRGPIPPEKPLVEQYAVRKMRVSLPHSFDYQIDGELVHAREEQNGLYSLTISVVPGALSFLVPPEYFRKLHPVEPSLHPDAASRK